MKRIIIFVILLTLLICGSIFAYSVNAFASLYEKGYYLRALTMIEPLTDGYYRDEIPDQIATPHFGCDYVYVGSDYSSSAKACFDLQEVMYDFNPEWPRVPKDWNRLAYGDYFSAYINTSAYTYSSYIYPNTIDYNPHDWLITFKDDKGNIVAQDLLTGELSDYFYERSFDDGNYFSFVEFSATNSQHKPEMFHGYLIGISGITVNAVPEPSSLLALAFGGAGTAIFAIRRRK